MGARLAPLGPMPMLCSDLLRARETAEIIAAHWGGTVEPDARWRETHCGDFEGRPWSDFTADAELQARYDTDPYHTAIPGGESAATMAARAVAAFTDALARPEPRLAIVSHGGPLCAVLAHVLAVPYTHFWKLLMDHAGLTSITETDGWLAVKTMNDVGHLTV